MTTRASFTPDTGRIGKADRAGGATAPEPATQSQPKALIPCAICNDDLANPFDTANQPSGGVEFTTPGHYGSAVFDPMDGTYLAINICDRCLGAMRQLRHVGIYRNGKFKKWGRFR
jgi:hypothetical protein